MASGIIVFAIVFVSNRDAGNRKRFAAIVSVALGGHPSHPVELPPGQGTLHRQLEISLKMRMMRMRVVEMMMRVKLVRTGTSAVFLPARTCRETSRIGRRHFMTRTISSLQLGPGLGRTVHLWRQPSLPAASKSKRRKLETVMLTQHC